jgi:hypothetical protein
MIVKCSDLDLKHRLTWTSRKKWCMLVQTTKEEKIDRARSICESNKKMKGKDISVCVVSRRRAVPWSIDDDVNLNKLHINQRGRIKGKYTRLVGLWEKEQSYLQQ